MPLIVLNDVDYGVGGPLLLEHADLAIEPGERIALIGRNGAGKTTLMKLLSGELVPDDGQIRREDGLVVARMEQEVPHDIEGRVFDAVAAGFGEAGALIGEYHRLSHAEPVDAEALARVQQRIEASHGWALDRRVTDILERVGLDGEADVARLSGGLKRRVLLARALVSAPRLLLLDEPTNHLDIEAIDWLEDFLRNWATPSSPCALMFVTHDRRFLRALATRIVEIDRGGLTSWPGDWANYVRRREERDHAEAQERARFDKLLAQEETWIRQGIKARRTRDEGRVRRLEAMRVERARRREAVGNVRLQTTQAEASGRKVVEVRDLVFSHGARPIVQGFSTLIQRGDRVGLIGPNGSGKTTLLKLLLGDLRPDAGEVRLGTGLEIAVFDQHRASLREDWNALDNVAGGREFIDLGNQRKHALGYLQDFLFTPERARAPITRLSGGERNRLLLAKLFAQPSNLLVMDEPTNDLDVETLELLEDLLADYAGTLLLVSHDRDFLDRVVTTTLVMEGEGHVGEYVGGYSDWLRQRPPPNPAPSRREPVSASPPVSSAKPVLDASTAAAAIRPAKRSYKETRELEQLPARIETLETTIAAMTARMSEAAWFQRDAAAIAADHAALADAQRELDAAYARWAELEP